MDVKNIIQEWLQAHGYDCLCNDECGCGIEDLFPCDNPGCIDCIPGHRRANGDIGATQDEPEEVE